VWVIGVESSGTKGSGFDAVRTLLSQQDTGIVVAHCSMREKILKKFRRLWT
jgi:phosphoribosylaminoimidazole (AIR) synthetase